MAQISDVMHTLSVFDAARQELAWAYSGDFADVPEAMEGAVRTILEVLNEAEMRWVASTSEEKTTTTTLVVVEEIQIKDWLVSLKEVANKMRALARKKLLLDECGIDNKPSARWFPCIPRGTKTTRTVPTTIEVVAEKLEELKKQYERFGYTTGLPLATCTETPPCVGGHEEIVTADVLVRGDDKQRIIGITTADQIDDTDDDYYPATILPVIGPPCVGKTTLVKSVVGDERFRDYLKVMISLPKGWELIAEEIFRETMTPSERWHTYSGGLCSIKYVKRLIRDELDKLNKRLLLVLDDLGCSKEHDDIDVLEGVRSFLYDVGDRVIAIVVTPSEAIAEYMSKTLKPYRLHPMSDDMCWEIIKGTASACDGLQQTRTTAGGDQGAEAAAAAASEVMMGHEIASKCSGLPLAAKALGRYYLQSSSVKPQEWQWPTGVGENPDIWNTRRVGGGFSPPAASQSQLLPLHSLVVFTRLRQSCSSRLGAESWLSFAYCAFVLPKGKAHSLVARDLLNHWCSLGITTPQRGTSCVSELLDRSLLLREKPSLTVAATLLTWKGLMHVFASYRLNNRFVVVGRNGATPLSSSANKSIINSRTYMALTLAATLLTMEDLMHDFARYLLGDRLIVVDGRRNGATPPPSCVDESSSRAYLALVRNLDGNNNNAVVDISSTLPAAGILALRFEDCRETKLSDGEFASAKYACLRLLDLSGCSVNEKLPGSVRHLKQLRYLKAPGIRDQALPTPVVRGLRQLRYLNLQGSRELADLTDAFQRLSNLLHLCLSGCAGLTALPASFGRLWRLQLLDLSACSGLESLPDDALGRLRSLTHLDLSGCSGLKALPGSFERLAGVLQHLDLSRCSGLEVLPSSLDRFSELRYVDLSELPRITRLPDRWPDTLAHLDLSGCSGLTDMAPIYRTERLWYLDLSGCSRLQEPSERFLEDIRRNGGKASGPKDASLK